MTKPVPVRMQHHDWLELRASVSRQASDILKDLADAQSAIEMGKPDFAQSFLRQSQEKLSKLVLAPTKNN